MNLGDNVYRYITQKLCFPSEFFFNRSGKKISKTKQFERLGKSMNGRFRIETLKGKKETIDQTKGKNT